MERNRRKRIFVWTLILAMLLQNIVYAGEWKQENSDWYYEQEGVRQVGWIHDGSGWYYMDQDGKLRSGWFQEGETWYFLNTVHDGFYGRALTDQWAWVDGYCYLFDSDGKMYANCTTPDGYEVNGDGRWTVDGVVQFVDGKGIITKETASTNTFSGGSGGGSSSSGGSGGSSTGDSGSNQGEGSINDGSGENTSGGSDTDDGGFVSEDFPGVVFTEAVEIENVDFTVESDSNTVVVSDSEAVQNWKVGEVYVLHDEEFPENDIAVKVTGILQSDSGAEISYEMPELGEVVDSIEVQGTESTYGEFIPAEGVTMTPVEPGMSRMRMARAAVPMVDTQGTLELFKKYHLEGEWEDINISGEFMVESIDYHFSVDNDAIEVISLSVNDSFDGTVQYREMGKAIDKKLGGITCRTPSGFWIRGNVYFRFNSEGEITIDFHIDNKTGIQYTNTQGFSPILEFHGGVTNVKLTGSMSARVAVEPVVTYLGIKLFTVGLEGGYGFDGSAEIYNKDPLQLCMDGKLYDINKLYAEISLGKFSIYEYEQTINGAGLDKKLHVEETGIVEKCTREDCSYKGIVTDALTSNPVGQAKVELFRDGSSAETVMTDQNGRFEGYILISTEHDLKVTADGYQPYETTVIPQMGKPPELAISLIPEEAKTGKLSANILNQNNDEPIANAKVEIIQKDSTVSVVYTDDNGFCQTDLIAGTYTLHVSADGFKEYEKSFEITEGGNTSLEIEMSPDQLSEEGVGGWEAYVTDSETGEPVSGAKILILKDDVMDSVFTDSNGYAAASEILKSGDYRVWVDWLSDTGTLGKYEVLLEEISIIEGETVAYEWKLTPRRAPSIDNGFYGYVESSTSRFRIIPNACIEIYQDNKLIASTVANDTGYFECEFDVGDEPYTLIASAPGYEPCIHEGIYGGTDLRSSYEEGNESYLCFNLELKEVPVTFNITVSNGLSVSLPDNYFEMRDGWYWLDDDHFGGVEPVSGNVFTAELWYGTYILHIKDAYGNFDADTSISCKPTDVEFTIDENNEDNVVVNIELELEEERSNKLLLDMESVEEIIEMSEQLLVEEGIVDSEKAEGLENQEMQQDKESSQDEKNEDEAELEKDPVQDKENESEAELEKDPVRDEENEGEAEPEKDPVQDKESESEAELEKDPVQDEKDEGKAEAEKDPVQDEEDEGEAEAEKDPVQDEENESEVELEKDPVQDEENESEAELDEELTPVEENESEGKEEGNNAENESVLEIETLANVNDSQKTDKNSKTDEDPSADENSEHKETSQK